MPLNRLMSINNLLDADPTLADNELLLGATFLKHFGYRPKVNIEKECTTYKTLNKLMLSLYPRVYDPDLIRKVIKKRKADRNTIGWNQKGSHINIQRTIIQAGISGWWDGFLASFIDYPACIDMVLCKVKSRWWNREDHSIREKSNDLNLRIHIGSKNEPVEILILDQEGGWQKFSF